MHPILYRCPVCGEALTVARLHCQTCDTAIEGCFTIGRFERLSAEQMAFVETFVRCEGKLNRVAEALRLSYPTIRSRLREVIRALDQEGRPPARNTDADRGEMVDAAAHGQISAEQAQSLARQG